MKIEIKSIFGDLLFKYDCENNTIKKTLEEANLREANLRGADLREANLIGANLIGANLIGADLPIFCKWNVSIKNDKIVIGCKEKTIEEWDIWFNSDEVFDTQNNNN